VGRGRREDGDVIIYFAAVNQHHYCEAFRGRDVLESFADVRPLMDRYRPTFASMILDSGAFSERMTGVPIDLGAYADFALAHRNGYRWVASLDSISGGPDKNVENWEALKDRGLDTVPTFHQGEPFSLLRDYCAAAPRIGLGFQRPIKNARPWLAECFAHIPVGHKVHGWAMTSYTADFPFESVDSQTWQFEVRALLAHEGQGAEALRCLTLREIVDIVQRKYERLPKQLKWETPDSTPQLSLLEVA
jgi:hypothetical protein